MSEEIAVSEVSEIGNALGGDVGWDDRFESVLRPFLPFLPAGEPLTDDSVLRDLGLDSMGTVELLATLESAYDVRFRDDALDLENFANPSVLWRTLTRMAELSA